MRQLLSIMLCIYVLAVMMIPCHCTDNGCEYTSQTSQMLAHEDNHNDQQDNQESCTPFCSCSSIHGANYFIPLQSVSTPVAYTPSVASFFYLMRIPQVECVRFKTPPEV